MNQTSAIGPRRDLLRQTRHQGAQFLCDDRRRCGAPPDHRHLGVAHHHRGRRLAGHTAQGLQRARPLRRPRQVERLRGGLFGRLARCEPGRRPLPLSSLDNPCSRRRAPSCPERTDAAPGRRDDPLYRARRILLRGEETLDDKATERLWSVLSLGDAGADVAIASRSNERLRDFSHARSRPRPRHARRAPGSLPQAGPAPEVQGSDPPSATGSTTSPTPTSPG
jgi:hypothetical protein